MQNSRIAVLLAATLMMAGSAVADSVSGEIDLGSPKSTSYVGQYISTGKLVSVGVRAEVTPSAGDHFQSNLSLRAGPNLPPVLGFKPVVYGEVGKHLEAGLDRTFWGAGVNVTHKLSGPLSLEGGYRHRQGFGGSVDFMFQNRAEAGLNLAVTKSTTVGARYYHDWQTNLPQDNVYGVVLTQSF